MSPAGPRCGSSCSGRSPAAWPSSRAAGWPAQLGVADLPVQGGAGVLGQQPPVLVRGEQPLQDGVVAAAGFPGCQVGPDRAQVGHVPGPLGFVATGVGRGRLGRLPLERGGEHAEPVGFRCPRRPGAVRAGCGSPCAGAVAYLLGGLAAGGFQRGGGPGAGPQVGAALLPGGLVAQLPVGVGGAARGGVGHDVGVVGGPAAGHGHVDQGAGQRLGDHGVGGVDGAALRGVGRAGVAEHGGAAQVVRGDGERAAPPALAADPVAAEVAPHDDLLRLGGQRVGLVALDAPHVAVGGPPAVAVGDGAVVAAGLDQVAGPGGAAVGQGDLAVLLDQAEGGQLGAGAGGQVGGLLVGGGDQQRVAAGQVVGEPAAVGGLAHLLGGSLGEPPCRS